MHEKTVLLPLVIFSLAYPKRPTEVLCITISAMLSMYDLLQRDGHASTYTASMLLLSAAAVSSRPSSFSERCVTAATICAVVLYHTAQALLPPPAKYPWFYPYLAASLCCARQAPPPPPTTSALISFAAFRGPSSRRTGARFAAPLPPPQGENQSDNQVLFTTQISDVKCYHPEIHVLTRQKSIVGVRESDAKQMHRSVTRLRSASGIVAKIRRLISGNEPASDGAKNCARS